MCIQYELRIHIALPRSGKYLPCLLDVDDVGVIFIMVVCDQYELKVHIFAYK